MATREFTRVFTGEALRNAVTEAAAPQAPVDRTVYVRLDEEPAKAKLTREGFQFPSLEPDVGRIKDYVDHLPPLAPHVLSQTPAKGTKVPRGSTVEVVMGYGGDLPVGSFVGSHLDLSAMRVDDVYERFLGDQTIRVAVSREQDVRNWRPEERAALQQRIQEHQVSVNEEDSARNTQSVVNALIVANTYGYKG